MTRHFLSLLDLSSDELHALIRRASELKRIQHRGDIHTPLKGKNLGMIFEKSSTRTRVSFEVGMSQLGGHALFLSPRDTQLGRGEPIEDSARVLSRMLDIIMIRTYDQSVLERFAAHSKVPVINALTDLFHPCQLLADMQTYFEHRGDIRDKRVAWIGDGNNMCHSYINAAKRFDFHLNIACPEGYDPDPTVLQAAKEQVSIVRDPLLAAEDADLIVTDVWASMGQEEEQVQREKAFARYQVNDGLMARAADDALFFHCLPAHRGEEVSASVIDREESVVWDEAENRLHSQKALMEFLLLGR
ncbi:MAG: ornithine carbamoyltransferase [Candidatus Thiodiazotropha sp. (ex Lucina aurantia)]|uniref:Ornithine carbamoyltransferase n=2 Tax=Candidatus Thiodiazotropha TaxID=1913444 RepID=A0A7Z1AFP9_9GAMM|nr:ornithine carbamoyltransferase [Candidatus Thiodiazotropha endolucinida]MBT3010411.1 ornithine carbamoyltransferase [Candidatus Thiodiazotropha sp. (ex Lucina pensylvanica)]MBT3014212.1 ornithine carbamoyltransferase [Candidatus Thiodiazotropha taylori]MBT3037912.1 ornithine carbamoyltransferase [Candidatus Thiodiazotropha sp. (ex Codakia orbicularis)]MBV2102489.1 ornithine carbamoyltransferase [Candidatus Thiodiazotropha sp. (ex Lucina aurantia)]MBT3021752.1 ornithine carbamoyltransferase 